MDLSKPPPQKPKLNDGRRHTGKRPEWLNPLHLQMIQELNAVELLPQMLVLEGQLNTLLVEARQDLNSPLPALLFDIVLFAKEGEDPLQFKLNQATPAHQRDKLVINCRVAQCELLGTMALLLQRQGAAEMEQVIAIHRKAWLEAELALIGRPARETPRLNFQNGRVIANSEAPYSPGLRTDIRTTVETFLKTVPPEQRKGASAMPKVESP